MKILKWIFGILSLIFIALLIYSFTLPSIMEFDVTKTLNANNNKIYQNVNDFKNWEKWSAWHTMDENMKITYGKKHSGINGTYSWTSNNERVGNGSMKITKSNPKFVAYHMNFGKNGTANSWFKIKPTGNKTEVTWGFKSDEQKGIISKLMMNLMMKPAIKKSYHKSLTDLEKVSH